MFQDEFSMPLIAGRFKIGRKLGEGSFGDVYTGVDQETGYKLAIKLSKVGKEENLRKEARFYQYLDKRGLCGKDTGIGDLYWCGTEGDYYFLIMERLGVSYTELLDESSQDCLDLVDVLRLAIEGISILERLHGAGMLHRDMKPANFMLGRKGVSLIDFGLAKIFLDNEGNHHPLSGNHKLVGTARYVSRNVHLGLEQGRRDDLESFGYVLVYLLSGTLPWVGLKLNDKAERNNKIGQLKMSVPLSRLCQGLPSCFYHYLEYTRNLEFDELPNYQYLRGIFTHFLRQYTQLNNHYHSYQNGAFTTTDHLEQSEVPRRVRKHLQTRTERTEGKTLHYGKTLQGGSRYGGF